MTKKHINVGLVAHVDAGKTTLSEALLYLTGQIRKAGRVDHMDSFMDTDSIERERGITIFSSQARITDGDFSATLLDTPGHVDFSAEMERTLKVIDYAILVISGTDGVQSHTRTLWKLLAAYHIPVFLFINKMDLPGTDRGALMESLKKELSEGCVDFSDLHGFSDSHASSGLHGFSDSRGSSDLHGFSDSRSSSDLHGFSDSRDSSDLHGFSDSRGSSGLHGFSDSHGSSDLHGFSDSRGSSGLRGFSDLHDLSDRSAAISLGSDDANHAPDISPERRVFPASDELCEEIAVLQESLLNEYMEEGHISLSSVQKTISDRILFPCYFGSALKFEGVEVLIAGLKDFTLAPSYPDAFAAKVYKIGRDPKGVRLTFLKLTGGSLKVKDLVSYGGTAEEPVGTTATPVRKQTGFSDKPPLGPGGNGSDSSGQALSDPRESSSVSYVRSPSDSRGSGPDSSGVASSDPGRNSSVSADDMDVPADLAPEKVDQIRLYSGDKYTTVTGIAAGEICAVTGLSHTCPGMGLGQETSDLTSMLEPVMTYQLLPPADVSPIQMAEKCRQLVEEDPLLHIEWNEELKELHVRLMGEVQLEVLTRRIWDRFGIHVAFGPGDIIYKETIAKPVEGVGHFEPLRHYAEVHILIEPGEPGSGIQVSSACSTDVLDGTKQRMIAMHLKEHEHRGVLTGSVLTDVKFTILTGRAHQKHTQGGDFRKATWRAVRHGLKCTESVLLEPYYRFILDLPTADVGRAITDLDRRFSHFGTPEYIAPAANGTQMSRITGTGPVSTLWDYAREVHSYTNGIGSMACELSGYDVCHNSEEVIEKRAYDSEADTKNPTGSVFCAHGAGFPVPWYDVVRFMHLPPAWDPGGAGTQLSGNSSGSFSGNAGSFSSSSGDFLGNPGNRPAGSAGNAGSFSSSSGDFPGNRSGRPADPAGNSNGHNGGSAGNYSSGHNGGSTDYSPEDIPDTFIDGSPRNNRSLSDSTGSRRFSGYSDGYSYRTEGRSFSGSPEPKRKNWENKVASMSEVALEAELADVYAREFGMSITDLNAERYRRGDTGGGRKNKPTGTKVKHDRNGNPIYPKQRQGDEYLIVDGYNVIFAWEELRELSKGNIDAARDRLNDILLNYQAWRRIRVLVVYDAYRVKGGAGHTEVYAGKADQDVRKQKEKPGIDTTDGIIVAFTKADETADAFIERTVNELGKKYRVTVVSGDGLIQLTILSLGALRMTAANLKDEIDRSQAEIRQKLKPGDEAVTRISTKMDSPKTD